MILRPANIKALQAELPESKRVEAFDLSAIRDLLEHEPENLTATAQAGMSLADFQSKLAEQNQWLPIDPPCPANLTLGALLADNATGPRRFGFGTIRDWLIGIAVVLPDGRLIRNGGKVVKNVAGFDLCKLLVGSRGTLGVIVEATFKLLPKPASEIILKKECRTLDEASPFLEQVWQSELQPHVLDLHRMDGQPIQLVIGFNGAIADVNAQAHAATQLGFNEETNLNYDATFRSDAIQMKSVPPSNTIKFLQDKDECDFLARAGNGVIYSRQQSDAKERNPSALEARVKTIFDPKGVLPEMQ